jgi:zinc D-Ala-D-Ala dipeptidase
MHDPPPVDECGEALVELAPTERLALLNLYFADGWDGTAPTVWLRRDVARRLAAAAASLPGGFGLAVFDGWRSPATVRALYRHFYGPGSTLPPGFLADPDDPDVVPPHGTGAAVDLTLTWHGRALALGTCFDDFTDLAHLRSLESAPPSDPARGLRRLLHLHLGAAGFVGMREEWWHVSHGDQFWAHATGATSAPYGPTQPTGGTGTIS